MGFNRKMKLGEDFSCSPAECKWQSRSTTDLFRDVSGKTSNRIIEKCGNEIEKEQKVWGKSVPNWVRCVAESLAQLL